MAIAVFIFGSMFFAIIMCPLALASNSIVRPTDEVRRMYESWMVEHGKSYGSKEKETRFQIFQSNVQFVDDHNRPENGHSYTVGLNRFADLTNKEYRKIYLSKKPFEDLHGNASTRYSVNEGDVNIPASIDWRSKGAVTSVKEQGKCGCCWAFTAVGAVEGINQIVTGKLVTLSAQELVDCDTGGFNHGCLGGNMYKAFEFIKNNGGIDTDADYPYKTTQNTCDLNKKNTKIVTIDGYESLRPNDENALKNAVVHQPITVGIESYRREFQLYSNGIYQGPCSYNLDHGALVVGYGEADGVKYWILKNTWGTDWGEKGYMRIQRDSGNFYGKCGMTRVMSYPVKNAANLKMIDEDSLRIKIINDGGESRSLDE